MILRPSAWLLAGLISIACGPKADDVAHYKARGVITAIARDPDETVITIHHESIPGFKDRDGKASTMDSMKMNFSVGQDPAKDLATGDKLGFEFDVHWNGGPPLRITQRQKLAPETTLALSVDH
jgi:Cu/Ag efflux protein CusF